jgi:hypothetical protein
MADPLGSLKTWLDSLPVAALLVLVGAAAVVLAVVAALAVPWLVSFSGWRGLSHVYRAAHPCGDVMSSGWGAVQVGSVRYRNTVHVGADAQALCLEVSVLFRVGHPPLRIPWEDVTILRGGALLWRHLELRFRRSPVAVRVDAGAEEWMRAAAGPAWPGIHDA